MKLGLLCLRLDYQLDLWQSLQADCLEYINGDPSNGARNRLPQDESSFLVEDDLDKLKIYPVLTLYSLFTLVTCVNASRRSSPLSLFWQPQISLAHFGPVLSCRMASEGCSALRVGHVAALTSRPRLQLVGLLHQQLHLSLPLEEFAQHFVQLAHSARLHLTNFASGKSDTSPKQPNDTYLLSRYPLASRKSCAKWSGIFWPQSPGLLARDLALGAPGELHALSRREESIR